MLVQRLTLEGSSTGPRLLISAGVHGDELEPIAAVQTLIRTVDPAKLRGRLTLAPIVNEPAWRLRARAGPDGLDLARTCPGDPAGSETQRIAAEFAALIRDTDFLIDLHTGGVILRLHPLAGYMLVESPGVLTAQRAMARAFGLPLVWGTSATPDGRSLSVARDAGIPAIYVEHGGGGTFEGDAVNAMVAGCLRVMRSLNMLEGVADAPSSASQIVIEDPRDSSGVLQVQHPAPVSGWFEPAVTPGQRVCQGDLIGRIHGVLGEPLAEARAHERGVVAMLRAWRSVERGDALAALACDEFSGGER